MNIQKYHQITSHLLKIKKRWKMNIHPPHPSNSNLKKLKLPSTSLPRIIYSTQFFSGAHLIIIFYVFTSNTFYANRHGGVGHLFTTEKVVWLIADSNSYSKTNDVIKKIATLWLKAGEPYPCFRDGTVGCSQNPFY